MCLIEWIYKKAIIVRSLYDKKHYDSNYIIKQFRNDCQSSKLKLQKYYC